MSPNNPRPTPGPYSNISIGDPNYPDAVHAVANQSAQAQRMLNKANAGLKAVYESQIEGYNFNVGVGRPPANVPVAPFQFVFDETGNLVAGTERITSDLPLATVEAEPPEGTFDIGTQLDATHFAQGVRDRTLAGTTKMLPNGITVRKVGFFFGGGSNPKYGGWYEIVEQK